MEETDLFSNKELNPFLIESEGKEKSSHLHRNLYLPAGILYVNFRILLCLVNQSNSD